MQALRISRGITQKTLANRSEIPLTTIQALEIGHNKIDSLNLNYLLRICEALNCKIGDIIEEPDNIRMYIRTYHNIKY